MAKSGIHRLFAAVLFVFCLASTGSASYKEEFSAKELGSWTFENAASVNIENGFLSVRGAIPMQIISPPGLGISPEEKFLLLKLRSKKDGYCFLTFGLTDGSVAAKKLRLKGNWDYSRGLRDYKVYIGDIAPSGVNINGLAIGFTGSREIEARIGSVSLYRPGFFESAGFFLDELLEPDFIDTWTISFITTPAIADIPLPAVIFIIAILAAVAAMAVIRLRNKTASLPKLIIAALVIGWAVISLRMDYNWLSIWGDEAGKLYGKDEAQRVKAVNNRDIDDFIDFTAYLKSIVPADKKISAAFRQKGNPLETMVAYYALPLKTSADPDIVWVYGIGGLEFDPVTGTLSMNGETLPFGVRPYAEFRDLAAIFEVIR